MPDEEKGECVDLSKYLKFLPEPAKTYICYPKGTEGFNLVREARARGVSVEDMVADLLKKAMGK